MWGDSDAITLLSQPTSAAKANPYPDYATHEVVSLSGYRRSMSSPESPVMTESGLAPWMLMHAIRDARICYSFVFVLDCREKARSFNSFPSNITMVT